MRRTTRTSFKATTLALLVAFTLVSCSTPAPTPTPKSDLDLEGLWLVTPGPGTSYGSGGTTTLRFGAGSGGAATFLSRLDASDVTVCNQHIYSVLPGDVVLLAGTYYTAEPTTNEVVLKNSIDTITLTRVTGTPPVAACGEAEAEALFATDAGVGSWSTLSAVGRVLYFNQLDGAIVGYDTASGALGAPRSYSWSGHNWAVAARSDDLFYGHCACGGSTSLEYFDLATDAGIVDIDYYGTIGEFGIRYGYFDGTNPVLGGSLWSGPSRSNALVTVDADTLVPIADRTILDGLSPAALTLHDGELLALLSDRIVVVGDDGRAERTYKVAGIGPRSMRGIASAGGTLYVLARDDSTGWAHIYEVELE
ncbi:MAG: hypothetical protein KF875_13310 [Trueperaceae bacterium]|nr:hypothetical protein [Trueperaceae bacterium]MCO5174796.1 hypothetical protein [Trueperaceae bacterium]MCW5821065.1 hypothetical protein [Trueperaceae bacterium]